MVSVVKVIGLMSGTSCDGIDAALVEVGPKGRSTHLIDFAIFPYPKKLQRALIDLATGSLQSVATVCHLNFYLGERFAEAAIKICHQANVPLSEVTLIGSHGQTVHHLPTPKKEGPWAIRSTLQIGEPSIIAERTGITTIADFRPRDIAAGGEGAPLTPFFHFHQFSHPKKSRAIVNIGGISNVTYLAAKGTLQEVVAFDTGPGNMVMDGLAYALTQKRMDRDGRIARAGAVNSPLLSGLMRHPFVRKAPPKSTGREVFGHTMIESLRHRKKGLSTPDLMATIAAFTAESIAYNIKKFIMMENPLDEIVVGGGGVKNPVVMRHLAEKMAPLPVRSFEELGSDSRAIEAITFALLAYYTAHGLPTGIPSVTGARRETLLGKIIPTASYL
jgi:anhydro-N-acetylmuramic acid kinase